MSTGRTLRPGERIAFRCHGEDPRGRELSWWLHPYNRPRGQPVQGTTAELTWHVHRDSIGQRIYLGIGMAAASRYHREGAPDEQGYDGWLVFYYRVVGDSHLAAGRRHPGQQPVGTSGFGREGSRTVHIPGRV